MSTQWPTVERNGHRSSYEPPRRASFRARYSGQLRLLDQRRSGSVRTLRDRSRPAVSARQKPTAPAACASAPPAESVARWPSARVKRPGSTAPRAGAPRTRRGTGAHAPRRPSTRGRRLIGPGSTARRAHQGRPPGAPERSNSPVVARERAAERRPYARIRSYSGCGVQTPERRHERRGQAAAVCSCW